ncbi:MAG: major facilitator transporter [uncultured bacterium]|nr:MAG: major facilitator transporter [uncultured bacterium]
MPGIAEEKQPVAKKDSLHGRVGAFLALFVTGYATFINLYVTQPLLPQFREIFQASELLVSLTVSAPVLAVALAAPLVGLLADALGRKRVIIAAMLGLSLPTIMAATAVNLNQLIVWRFLQGLFIPGIISVVMAYISEESPRQAVGATMATYVTGTVVGGFSGRFIVGLCATHYNWRVSFVCIGVITLAGCLTSLWLLPRATKFIRQTSATASLASLRTHLKNPQLLATYAIGFNVLFCQVGTFTYVNFYLADKPFFLGPAALGAIFTVYLIGAVITPAAGMLLDRIGYRRTLRIAVEVIIAGMLLTLIRSLPVIITGLTLASTGVFACQAAASSYVGKAAGKARSSAAGLYVALYYFGGSLGSILPGLFWKNTGWTGCVVLILCMQVVILFIANIMWKDLASQP